MLLRITQPAMNQHQRLAAATNPVFGPASFKSNRLLADHHGQIARCQVQKRGEATPFFIN
jgi:hypothetical protein